MNQVSHFAVHADDLARARRFYGSVFGWTFKPWGPPDFFMVDTGDGGIHGSLQKRTEPVSGRGMIGYECTMAVEDVHATARLIAANGGSIVVPAMAITGVGTLIQFVDTEGNVACAMQYDETIE